MTSCQPEGIVLVNSDAIRAAPQPFSGLHMLLVSPETELRLFTQLALHRKDLPWRGVARPYHHQIGRESVMEMVCQDDEHKEVGDRLRQIGRNNLRVKLST